MYRDHSARAHAHHVARRRLGCSVPPFSRAYSRAPRPTPARSRRSRRPGRRRRRRSHRVCTRGGRRRATSAPPPSSTDCTSATKSVWSPVRMLVDRARDRASPRRPASRRGSSSRTSMPFQSAIGGTLRAKCCARCSWSPARIDAVHSSASRSSSCSDACARSRCRRAAARATARRATRRSAPARRPSTSATTTDTPAGHRRKSARCSAPRSSTGPSLARRNSVRAGTGLSPSCVIASFATRSSVAVVRARRRPLPHHVGRDAGPFDRRAVLRSLAGRLRAVRVEA